MAQTYPSLLLERAVNEVSKLPGIGQKSALRLVLHLLRQESSQVHQLSDALTQLRDEIHYCRCCHNISDTELCQICSDPRRDASTVCVVENIRDVMAVEATGQFHGLYHVLGGLISPMNSIGPGNLEIQSLVDRVAEGKVKEVILALSTTMEGDTTGFYIYRRLEKFPDVTLSALSRGVSIGDEIEFIDEVTLGRSIVSRTPYKG